MVEMKVQNQVKVDIQLVDGKAFFGYVYLDDDYRLQDLMNDYRRFIPVHRHKQNSGRGNEDIYRMVMINKDHIVTINEVSE